ncbi:hypothetical protein [Streptomyces sp. NPDC002825]|uniref:hypothetical protein n=1 Tax=Streptomyces sp. NPDC002825 TaxID=3154666 RepID=UPI00332E2308
MNWYVVIPSALALLLVIRGAGSLRAGHAPSGQRRRVARPALQGWGQLAIGAAMALQACAQLTDGVAARAALGGTTFLGLIAGGVLLTMARVPRRNR